MNDVFVKRLRMLRKERNLTQEDVAKVVRIQRSTYGEYERGMIVPALDKIKILADFFGVSVDWLMGSTNFKTHQERDEQTATDVGKMLKKLLEHLKDEQSAVTFNGKLINEESRAMLISMIEFGYNVTNLNSKKR